MNQAVYTLRKISLFWHRIFCLMKDFCAESFFVSAFSGVKDFKSEKIIEGKIYEFLLKLEIRVSGFVKRIMKFIYDVFCK